MYGSHRDLDKCVRPGFMCPSTCCFVEKRSYEEKSRQKYENLTNIRIHVLNKFMNRNVFSFDADTENRDRYDFKRILV